MYGCEDEREDNPVAITRRPWTRYLAAGHSQVQARRSKLGRGRGMGRGRGYGDN